MAYTVPIAAVQSQVVQSTHDPSSSTERDLVKIKLKLKIKLKIKYLTKSMSLNQNNTIKI